MVEPSFCDLVLLNPDAQTYELSYHFNYGAFSEVMFDGDASVLLKIRA